SGLHRKRNYTQALRRELQLMARTAMVLVRGCFSSLRVMDADRERAYPHRHREQHASETGTRLDRSVRARFLFAAVRRRAGYHRMAVLRGVLQNQRAIPERRRPHGLACEIACPRLLHATAR